MSPSKLTTYCACHAKWPSNIWQKFAENSWNVISNARPIRDRSETVSVSPQPATQQRLLFALRTSVLYWKIQHFALRLSFQISPSTAPTTKSDTWTSPSTAPATKSDTWTSPSTAPTTQSDTWTSPSTAPTTQSDTWTSPRTAPTTKSNTWTSLFVTLDLHQVLRLPRKVTLELHQILRLPHRMTRMLDLVTYETSFPMRGATNVTLQTHHILRLPRKMTIQHLAEICGKQLKRHFQCAADPRPFRDRFRQSATRHATEVTFRAPDERFVLKNTTFRAPAIFPNFTKYCAYHEKWHLNFTKYCACHEKWHLNFTKYCAYHAKWHLNFTKYCAYHAKWHLNLTKYCAYHEKWHLNSAIYYAAILLSDSINWLYYYSAIYYSEILLIDSTNTQRSITQRFY